MAPGRHDVGVSVSVRPAGPSDVDALGRVHVHAWQTAYRGVMPDVYLDGLDPSDRSSMWSQFLERAPSDQRLQVVTVDELVVGFACFGRCPDADDGDIAERFAINLEPEYWGRGLGRRLLLEVVDDLREFGDQAVLWVVPTNARARSLYESTGWLDDGGRRQDEEGGTPVEEMRYPRIALHG